MDIYRRLGLNKVINAGGTYTFLGGSRMPREVIKAWVEAASSFVDMQALHMKASEIIAKATGAEAGLVTTGASGALLLAAAACIAGKDIEKMRKLPHSEGMPNEIIFPGGPGEYANCYMAGGARVVTVGKSLVNFTDEEILSAITDKTVALGYVFYTPTGEAPLKRLIALGKRFNLPVIVDAAAELPPLENLKRLIAWGADLVAFSGGKDIMGPNDTGILCGRRELIESAFMQSCPHNLVGRALKVSKEDIIACITALQRYISLDHEVRRKKFEKIVKYWVKQWSSIPHIKVEIIYEGRTEEGGCYIAQGWPRVRIIVDEESLGLTVEDIGKMLWEGKPSIYINTRSPMCGVTAKSFVVNPHLLNDREVKIVARRVKEVLLKGKSSIGKFYF